MRLRSRFEENSNKSFGKLPNEVAGSFSRMSPVEVHSEVFLQRVALAVGDSPANCNGIDPT